MHKIMPNMQAAHGSDIEIYSQVEHSKMGLVDFIL